MNPRPKTTVLPWGEASNSVARAKCKSTVFSGYLNQPQRLIPWSRRMPDNKPSQLKQLKDRLHRLFVGGEEVGREQEPTKLQQFFHFWRLVGQSFIKNRLPVRAASLSYTTILALVPMLALVMGITSSFLKDQSEERIGQFIDELVESLVPPVVITNTLSSSSYDGVEADSGSLTETNGQTGGGGIAAGSPTNALQAFAGDGDVLTNVPPGKAHVINEDVQEKVASSIKEFIQNTRSGTLGVISTAILIFMAISMLIRIETAFNDVWGVLKGRSLFMRLVLYWTVISLAPVMFGVALGLATGPYFTATQHLIADIPLVGWLLFQLLPFIILCLAFAVFNMLMPNTKVRWNPALIGGVVAALLWQINSGLSALYFSRVATNMKIYGGLGLIPVFMIGLYFAWMILLFGGQISYAWQNRMAYFQERVADNVNQRGREFVALRLMTMIGAAFQRGAEPPCHADMSTALEIPPRLTLEVLQTLLGARLIMEVNGPEIGYVPARPVESISCHDILHALRAGQGTDVAFLEEPIHRQILGEFERINDAERTAAESVSLHALALRANKLVAESGPHPNTLTNGNTAKD